MEQGIDRLAELARAEVEGGQFIAEVLTSLAGISGAARVRFWRKSPQDQWEVAGERPSPAQATEATSDDVQVLIETANSLQISTHSAELGKPGATQSAVRTICPIVYAGQTVALLDTFHLLEANHGRPAELVPFLQAIAEITADFLSQLELRQLRRARGEWQKWDQFTSSLMQSPTVTILAATIVNDGRILAGCDRVTLLQRRGSHYSTLAVSGVERVEPRANTVRSLETVAALAARNDGPVWFDANRADSSPDSVDLTWLAEHARLTGSRIVGLIPFPTSTSSPHATSGQKSAVLAFEQFQDESDVLAWRSRAEHLASRVEPLLLAALERESIPFVHTLQTLRRLPEGLRRPGPVLAMSALLATLAFLTFYPAEFTVTGQAELVPVHRREIFASSSGIVEKLLVAHGDDVAVDQPLVVLHDPQLSLELPRVIGEIEVVRERLKGVLAARLAGGATVDAANRARQLTSEEEELKERQQSLTRQKQLIEKQQEALTLKSPICGKVLTWDVATILSDRPVERGQALLTVGDTDGPWMIEMRVADNDFGHVRRAQARFNPNLEVYFVLPSDPSKSYRGKIRDVAETTQWDDQTGGSSVLVTVAIDDEQSINPRSGMTAIPRIQCGKQPIGYVWLHDLIDAIRTRWLM